MEFEMPAAYLPARATKTAARKIGRDVCRAIFGYQLRDSLWVNSAVIAEHRRLVAELARYGVVGNPQRVFGVGEGWRYCAPEPMAADLNLAMKEGDLQTIADSLAWWGLRSVDAFAHHEDLVARGAILN